MALVDCSLHHVKAGVQSATTRGGCGCVHSETIQTSLVEIEAAIAVKDGKRMKLPTHVWLLIRCTVQIGAALVNLMVNSITFDKLPARSGPNDEQLPAETCPVFEFKNFQGTPFNKGPQALGVIRMAPEVSSQIERSHLVSACVPLLHAVVFPECFRCMLCASRCPECC